MFQLTDFNITTELRKRKKQLNFMTIIITLKISVLPWQHKSLQRKYEITLSSDEKTLTKKKFYGPQCKKNFNRSFF